MSENAISFPMSLVESSLEQYQKDMVKLDLFQKAIEEYSSVSGYYNMTNNKEKAKAEINAKYWGHVLNVSHLLDTMPTDMKWKWHGLINNKEVPEFTSDNVIPTLKDLYLSQRKFFCEKVFSVFSNLSKVHLTNQPEGFMKRCIAWCASYNSYKFCEYMDDLRDCIADIFQLPKESRIRFADIHRNVETSGRLWGEWIYVDNNSFKIKFYMKGTVHIEFHPFIAMKLNQCLAELHPLAIPSKFTSKPKKIPKEFEQRQVTLTNRTRGILLASEEFYEWKYDHMDRPYKTPIRDTINFVNVDNQDVNKEHKEVCELLGGTLISGKKEVTDRNGKPRTINFSYWQFDFYPIPILKEIATSGYIPEYKSHQYYPTPESIVEVMKQHADIKEHHKILEPSTGTGNLIKWIENKSQVTCIEISKTFSKVLTEMGFNVDQTDFMKYDSNQKFDRILMNPPYSEGRANEHLLKAYDHLAESGILLAVLPSSFAHKELPMKYEVIQEFHNEFAKTSISTVLLKIVK